LVHFICWKKAWVAGKLCDPLTMRAIPERFCDGVGPKKVLYQLTTNKTNVEIKHASLNKNNILKDSALAGFCNIRSTTDGVGLLEPTSSR